MHGLAAQLRTGGGGGELGAGGVGGGGEGDDDGGAPPSSPGSDGGVGGCGACTFALRKTLQAGVCFSASSIDIGLCPWPIFLMWSSVSL